MFMQIQKLNHKSRRKNARSRARSHVPDEPHVLWQGRCWCDQCKGRAWPAHYMVSRQVRLHVRDFEGVTRYFELGDVSFECYLDAVMPDDDAVPVRVSTTQSASAEAREWLEAFGVEPSSLPLESENDEAIEREVALGESLMEHMAGRGYDDGQIASALRRLRNLQATFAGNAIRLFQWLRTEFPSWVVDSNPVSFLRRSA